VTFTLVQTPETDHGLTVKKIFSVSLFGPPESHPPPALQGLQGGTYAPEVLSITSAFKFNF